VLVPNTASLPANLLEQSCVPELNMRWQPSCAKNDVSAWLPSALKAVGLPT
jgi:hypothetical protein